jgi:predicted phosphate transport protein (TIGR00153 family)
MFGRLLPREEKFFDLFRQAADLIVDGAKEFRAMLSDLKDIETRAKNIKNIEHRADEVTHRTVELLHKTFITPLDREDIHQLISRMDDILDHIEAASERMYLYDIRVAPPEAIALADICIKSAEDIRHAVNHLENLKNPAEIIKHCVEVNRLENEADHILRSAMAKLFRDEPDTRQLIKLKEIFELLETVTDRCEDVANIVEGIVLEYA